jgi:large subunit ribosomal protein L11
VPALRGVALSLLLAGASKERMAKKVKAIVKIQAPAGKATPAPPIGPTLGQHGVNIADFVQKFNAATAKMGGDIIPAVLTIYEDRSFDFVLKTPPASVLLLKAAGIPKGSSKPLQEKVGKVTKAQIREIAEKKLPDLNTTSLESAMRSIEGTARQMGLEVVG